MSKFVAPPAKKVALPNSLLARFNAEDKGKTISEINPTKEDAFLTKMARGYDIQQIAKFISLFPTYAALCDWCSIAVQKHPGKGKIFYDLAKSTALTLVDPRLLDVEFDQMIAQKVLVEPHSAGIALANCAVVKCSGPSANGLKFKNVTDTEYEVTMLDRQTWYENIVTLLRNNAQYEKKRFYFFCAYDKYYWSMAMILTARYSAVMNGLVVEVIRRPGVISPPQMFPEPYWPTVGKQVDSLAAGLAMRINGTMLFAADETNELSLFYCGLEEIKWKPEGEDFDLVDFLQMSSPTVRVAASKDELAPHVNEFAKNPKGNTLVATAHAYLKVSRDWRKTILPLDRATHDLCLEAQFQHVPDRKWGPLHRQAVATEGLLKYEALVYDDGTKRKINQVHLIGPGGSDVARGLLAYWTDKRADPNNHPEVHVWQPSGVNVYGDYQGHQQKEIKMEQLFQVKGCLIFISDFTAVVEYGATDKKNTDIAMGKFVRGMPEGFDGVIIAHSNMSSPQGFLEALEGLYKRGYRVDFIRHPRRHNDYFFYVLYPNPEPEKQPDRDAAIDFQFSMGMEVMDNNVVRDNCMWFGMDPVKPNVSNPLLSSSFGYQMNVRDEGRHLRMLDTAATPEAQAVSEAYVSDWQKKYADMKATKTTTKRSSVHLADTETAELRKAMVESAKESIPSGPVAMDVAARIGADISNVITLVPASTVISPPPALPTLPPPPKGRESPEIKRTKRSGGRKDEKPP